jgi:transcriptional regulator with XRE-family HTH domain
MTGIRVAEIRRSMLLTPKEFATLCGVNEQTVYRWESMLAGPVPPMVESTRRVFLMLQGGTTADRKRWAAALQAYGWRAAWGQMFNGAAAAKALSKSKTRTR